MPQPRLCESSVEPPPAETPGTSRLAIDWPEVLTWDHDQVLRYTAVAELLDRLLAAQDGKVTILDVGCNILDPWKYLLDPEKVRIVRCDVEPLGSGPDFVLLERGRPLPFVERSFDAVVALEVLEHLPPESRQAFIADCFRVCRAGAIWTCPDGRPDVTQAEEAAEAAYRARHRQSHPFLREHAEYGPPTREEFRAALQALDTPYALFGNAPLSRWLALLVMNETHHEQAVPLAVRSRLNEQLGTAYPPGEAPYRLIGVAARSFAATSALEPLPPDSSAILLEATGTPPEEPVGPALNLLASLVARVGAESVPERERAEQVQAELQKTRQQLEIESNFAHGAAGSWSWRLLAPLRVMRRWVAPRRYGRQNLKVMADLEPIHAAEYQYRATTHDPQFLLPCTLPAGWIRVDYRLHTETASHLEIYADHHDGFTLDTRLHREAVEGATERSCYVYLPRPARALRLDPVEEATTFRLDAFSVRTVPPLEALGRAVAGKCQLLFKYRCFQAAMMRGVSLLARGRVGEFVGKLYTGLHGNQGDRVTEFSHETAYALWRENRQLTEADRQDMREWACRLVHPPRFSILLPTYNTPEDLLRACLDSVLRQTYPHWQLCIADDGSTATHVRPILEEYAAREPRISLVFRPKTGNISAATNSALEMAQGNYIALLDHDDELAEHALTRVAETLVGDPTLDMVYSDEDKIDLDGRHCDPFFKPDWSPEYFQACMYTCHLGVYRTALAREIGGFRSEFDTAQDYDFVLRFISRTSRIAHVPDVLYHWRKTPTSTASGAAAKPRAHLVAANALRTWLTETGQEGTVESTEMPGFHRVRFALKSTPRISVVIPSGAKRATLHGKETWFVARCVESLREQTTYPDVEVLVLYNDTIDPELEARLAGLGAKLINYHSPGPFNLAHKMNHGASLATGEQLVFLNDDIEVLTPNWLECMLEYSQQEGIGAVGARLLFPNGRLQHGGVIVPGGCPTHAFHAYPGFHPGYFNSQVVVRNWIAVTGACLMTRAELFRSVGGFDLIFPLNYNDVDYCLRLHERGFRSVCTPYARLVHHESVTKEGFFPVELKVFQNRWGTKLPLDPYYNANFNQSNHEFQVDPRAGSAIERGR